MDRETLPAVTGRFTYTFDEYTEAQQPVLADPNAQTTQPNIWQRFFGWGLFIAMAVLFLVLTGGTSDSTPPQRNVIPDSTPIDDGVVGSNENVVELKTLVIATIGPAVGICMIALIITLSVRRKNVLDDAPSTEKTRPASGGPENGGAVLVVVLVAGFLVLYWNWSKWFPQTIELSNRELIAFGAIPWAVVIALVAAIGRWGRGNDVRRLWKAQPNLQLPKVISVDEIGLRITDDEIDATHRWHYFKIAIETENLFVLREHALGGIFMLPKRAFSLAADMHRLRGLISDNVPDCRLRAQPSAFAVAAKG